MAKYHAIQPAKIDWQSSGPYSTSHDDVYFNTEDGLAETDYVFLQGNRLPERWQGCQQFTIAETGFGTGLNFLATAKAWLAHAPASARLRFISVEKFPLTHADLARALAQWPQLAEPANELIDHYPPLTHGNHQIDLFDGRIKLTLMLGDAIEMYGDLETSIDAWFLDGFAPGKNPEMWNEQLFHQIARLSQPGTTFATFTAAGIVRRGLEAVGFETQRPPGFGRKRNMLSGTLNKKPEAKPEQPWFHFTPTPVTERSAIVVGAGLAGCSAAFELARRGWQVKLIERHDQPGREASGNLAGVAMPRLTADMDATGQFYLAAFLHSQQWFNGLQKTAPELPWFQSGVIQFEPEKRLSQLARLGLTSELLQLVDREEASEMAGISVHRDGVLFPLAGWLQPPALCRWLSEQTGITRQFHHEALAIEYSDGHWHCLENGVELAQAPVLLLANGYDATRLLPHNELALQPVRGQVAYFEPTAASRKLKLPLCFDGYLLPEYQGRHCAGATYDPADKNLALKPDHAAEIVTMMTNELDDLGFKDRDEGRAALRTSSQDHLPLIGPIPDAGFFQAHYSDLHHGRPASRYPLAQHVPGLYLSSGHGSRGLVSCPFAARLLAELIDEGQSSVARSLQQAVHPARFMIRKFRRPGP